MVVRGGAQAARAVVIRSQHLPESLGPWRPRGTSAGGRGSGRNGTALARVPWVSHPGMPWHGAWRELTYYWGTMDAGKVDLALQTDHKPLGSERSGRIFTTQGPGRQSICRAAWG